MRFLVVIASCAAMNCNKPSDKQLRQWELEAKRAEESKHARMMALRKQADLEAHEAAQRQALEQHNAAVRKGYENAQSRLPKMPRVPERKETCLQTAARVMKKKDYCQLEKRWFVDPQSLCRDLGQEIILSLEPLTCQGIEKVFR